MHGSVVVPLWARSIDQLLDSDRIAAADVGLGVERFFAEIVPAAQTIFARTVVEPGGNSFD
jgi:hypothetical protein